MMKETLILFIRATMKFAEKGVDEVCALPGYFEDQKAPAFKQKGLLQALHDLDLKRSYPRELESDPDGQKLKTQLGPFLQNMYEKLKRPLDAEGIDIVDKSQR